MIQMNELINFDKTCVENIKKWMLISSMYTTGFGTLFVKLHSKMNEID